MVVSHATARILIVDDDVHTGQLISTLLKNAGFETVQATAYSEGARILEQESCDLVVSDLYLDGGKTGLELLQRAASRVPFVLMTGQADLETSVEAMNFGAVGYLSKPIEVDQLLTTVRRALEVKPSGCAGPVAAAREPRLVGRTAPIVRVYNGIARAARSDCAVLILGEQGVGKELVAREIHRRSARSVGPCVAFDCSGLSCDEFEQVFFGDSRLSRRGGLLEAAAGGTLILEHVHELPVAAQLILARNVRQEDVRLIATVRGKTPGTLGLEEELQVALSVLRIEVPSLAERMEDLSLIVEELLGGLEKRVGRPLRIADGARELLRARAWPGNVRELAHTLEAAGVAAPFGEIQEEDLNAVFERRDLTERAPQPAVSDMLPAARIKGYVLQRQLARTEFSDVWLGVQSSTGRKVVVKFVRGLQGEVAERFRRECRIQASLRHPRIPVVYEAGVEEQAPHSHYLVSEYVEGAPLGAYNRFLMSHLDEPARLRHVVQLIVQVAEVLDHLHRCGLVHRDVKPANILVTQKREAYLIDYGLAKSLNGSDEMTVAGLVQGTVPFMSPEHVIGDVRGIDGRSDVWSLGATLYQLLTGQHPFGGGEFGEVALRIRMTEPALPSSLNPHISASLEQVIMRALEKLPEQRFADAGEFQKALEAALAGADNVVASR
ncbi:MAG: protein kinase [Planctomycetes bacterium]|nr:protein kinase [Planctomycetota bacterium]